MVGRRQSRRGVRGTGRGEKAEGEEEGRTWSWRKIIIWRASVVMDWSRICAAGRESS